MNGHDWLNHVAKNAREREREKPRGEKLALVSTIISNDYDKPR